MNEMLWCANCEVQGRDKKKAARTYGRWGLCEECYVELGRPPLGAPKPTRPETSVHVPSLEVRAEEPVPSDVIGKALHLHGKVSANDVRKKRNEIEKEATVDTKERAASMQADRNGGMSVPDVAKKHGVTVSVVYGYTKMKPGTERVQKKAATPKPKVSHANGNGNGKTSAHPLGAYIAANGLIAKWNAEADAAFAALPLDKKAELLASLE